ncbi:RNA polymerase sigma-70 factor [Maribellus luteus]|uniref:RNA polymerase sigma-70 factor n=1 Tax=Maribellus luteus TaxID=2305463 RepID=A0A399SVW3_9BACT|nr:RNA polymerase sigma-70 factor [Maribellus luteus]RIJ48180.1 RNA polymerase sigma-70 factor [Maribellus luteus]
MDQAKLVKRLISGDKIVVNELYEKYSAKLYHFAFGYLKSEPDALDIVQEVFVNLWENRKKLNKDSNLNAYLFTIAKNTIISVFRKKLSEKQYLEDLKNKVVVNAIDTESRVNYDLLTEKITHLVDQLPPQRKKVYVLSKEKGFSNQAVADELGISVKTVEDHITKARKFLKDNLSEYGLFALLFIELFVS